MMRRNRFLKRSHHSEDVALQITSMADIFTILLVFLLKSYSSDVSIAAPANGMNLPVARGGDVPSEALKIEVSETGILVEGKPVTKLEQFVFQAGDLQENGSSKTLSRSLAQERDRQLLIAKQNSDVKADSRVMIMADQRTPYDTLKAILASSAVQGFTDFKLIVVKEE